MKLKALVVTFLFAAGVLASVAVAKGPPPGKGKSRDATTTSERGKGKEKKKGADCKPTVTFELKGEFVSAAESSATPTTAPAAPGPAVLGTFDMKVTRANKHGRQYVGKTATVSYNRKTSFRRRGHADLADFEPGDRLNVKVRACKPAQAARDDDEETTTTGSTSTTPSTGAAAQQELLLARKVDGKPKKTGTGTTTTTTTTTPTSP